ncbi:metalloendopeptidase [Plakobranchus ocellatus]|uniref:Metalloendopeptidase n=1 Tax=Plakobranchus ocellatus TaxID=259542 RepID=A0AAV3YSS7_9GAST|nr:metalloendopeptidase [Plakobranchus ocellatus]
MVEGPCNYHSDLLNLLFTYVTSSPTKERGEGQGGGVEDEGSEGVVEAYILARAAAQREVEEFYREADPGQKPDPNTEAMLILKYWRDQLGKVSLSPKQLKELLEGDPGLDEGSEQTKREVHPSVHRRSIVVNERLRWTKAIVPYLYLDSINDWQANEIQRAIQSYERFTCARFVPWENKTGIPTNDRLGLGHPSHLKFVVGRG